MEAVFITANIAAVAENNIPRAIQTTVPNQTAYIIPSISFGTEK